ncbi:MAG: DNA primase [Patescibacteria group bacterium]
MNRSNVEEIKKRIPIEELLASYVKLEKSGKSFKARCPFHNEKSASFFVSPERGGYYCFGCGAKGDIFSFVEQFEGLDFRGALKVLAERAGVSLVYDQKADGERDKLYDITDQAARYFEACYAKSKEAQDYVTSRGITEKTRAEFRMGWAPEGWSNLYTYLKGKGWQDALIEKAGLAKKGDKGDFYDRFRGRVMFPISDSSGRVIAFSGRILKPDDKSAKYINSPDSPLYDKSSVLYGLDKAKSEIRRLNYTILVEGQMDLVMSHQADIKNTVAVSGTAMAEDVVNKEGIVNNLGLIRRLSPNVIIAFDSDAAGKKAALRASAIALSIGMDVKIADIVGGKDPADLVKEDPVQWREILRNTKPVIEFELTNVLHEVTDQRKLPRALQDRVFPLVARIEKQTDKDYFVQMIADRSHISASAIWDDIRVLTQRFSADASATPTAQPVARKSATDVSKRIDLVERRMFGLLGLMESAGVSGDYRERIRTIAGATYDDRVARIQPLMSDVLFEAESFFGATQDRWGLHMQELLTNFEEDILSEQLMSAMQDLRTAEKAGDHARVAELATECQRLSLRKAEVLKKKRG